MFISRESDYAVRVVRTLADGEKKNIQKISEDEDITQQFAYKIARKLEQNGILTSYRGPKGGYTLAKPMDTLTLFDIISAVDEKLLIIECMACGYQCSQNTKNSPCRIHDEFVRIQSRLIGELKAKKMSELFS